VKSQGKVREFYFTKVLATLVNNNQYSAGDINSTNLLVQIKALGLKLALPGGAEVGGRLLFFFHYMCVVKA
jgi:hypothetical protein